MREIVLDTETTGLDPNSGDRIVEIGAIELFNHMPTGQVFHRYLNPDKKIVFPILVKATIAPFASVTTDSLKNIKDTSPVNKIPEAM